MSVDFKNKSKEINDYIKTLIFSTFFVAIFLFFTIFVLKEPTSTDTDISKFYNFQEKQTVERVKGFDENNDLNFWFNISLFTGSGLSLLITIYLAFPFSIDKK